MLLRLACPLRKCLVDSNTENSIYKHYLLDITLSAAISFIDSAKEKHSAVCSRICEKFGDVFLGQIQVGMPMWRVSLREETCKYITE